jgi:DNA repair protein SbcC/Rad50
VNGQPRLERVTVSGFQSLAQVELEIGSLTVVVGPSSSGKSALVRALRALASNVRGGSVVTRGRTGMRISAQTDRGSVTLVRTGSSSSYEVAPRGAPPQVFTKLSGGVPPLATEVLGIEPSSPGVASLTMAGQFEPPYLLMTPGSQVARDLGDLTSVSVVFAAAREASRRRGQVAAQLKSSQASLAQLQERVLDYATLPTRVRAATRGEGILEEAQGVQVRLVRLRALVAQWEQAQDVLDRPTPPEPPDLAPVVELEARARRLRVLAQALGRAETQIVSAGREVERQTQAETSARDQAAQLLQELGSCPTCGQTVQDGETR